MKPTFYSLRSLICRPQSTVYGLRSTISGLLSAFTLVELMVVVAVISLLLMMLVPNIRTMREKAWSSNCQNNLRQYGIAMNQYMSDHNGDFIYAGAGIGGSGVGYDSTELGKKATYGNTPSRSGGRAGSMAETWYEMTADYLPAGVTIQTLSAGHPSIRVCPSIMQQIRKDGNFFDPDSPNFKGLQDSKDSMGNEMALADFEMRTSGGAGYDSDGKLILDPGFTTYAINISPNVYHKNKKNIPENVIAFIDWNARDGWWATVTNDSWMFTGTNGAGVAVAQGDKKRDDGAWWLTEVGFHHFQGGVYGANYVAMDGHVGWIGSNKISRASFTNSILGTNITTGP